MQLHHDNTAAVGEALREALEIITPRIRMIVSTMTISMGIRFYPNISAKIAVEAGALEAIEAASMGNADGRKAVTMGDLAADTPIALSQNFFLAELSRLGIQEVGASIPGSPIVNPAVGGPQGYIAPDPLGNFYFVFFLAKFLFL